MYTRATRIYPVERMANGKLRYFHRAAEDLSVHPNHLRMVLQGKRSSDALMARIETLHPELPGLFAMRNA